MLVFRDSTTFIGSVFIILVLCYCVAKIGGSLRDLWRRRHAKRIAQRASATSRDLELATLHP
jgi:hypothetical protein